VTSFSLITQQEIIRLIESHAPLVVHDLLKKEYGYVPLEGTGLSENGAYFIHPVDWPRSDEESALGCWPVLNIHGYQFIGINPSTAFDHKYSKSYDGFFKAKPAEIKLVDRNAKNFFRSVNRKVEEAVDQNAVSVLICFDISHELSEDEIHDLSIRISGKLKKMNRTGEIETVHILTKNTKRIISR
jgi:hypothetical protein